MGHSARVSSLAWNNVTPSVIASGSKDKSILVRDLRAQNGHYRKLTHHK
jgi:cell division cycle 20-like protein 1, cofactor of APC complex